MTRFPCSPSCPVCTVPLDDRPTRGQIILATAITAAVITGTVWLRLRKDTRS